MPTPLSDICCASFASEFLEAVAEVRCVPGIRVALRGDRAWLRWDVDDRVLRRVMPIPGVRLYVLGNNTWFRHGRHLPAFEVPDDLPYRPLNEVLTPAAVTPAPCRSWPGQPLLLTLVPEDRPRTTTALITGLAALAAWADTVPAAVLSEMQAAQRDESVLLRGKNLPLLPAGERYWGKRVLAPLGFRPEPALSEGVIHEALGLAEDESLLLRTQNSEVLSDSVFQPLTRAGLRLARSEARR